MSVFREFAEQELKAVGYTPLDQEQEDGPNKWIQENVLELLEVFSRQGHSGTSAPYCISMFEKLANFEPLLPLQGTDDEWADVEAGMFQNKRCSSVFKDKKTGRTYDINGKVFVEPNGASFTSSDSAVDVEFPYTPKTEYVKVDEERIPIKNTTTPRVVCAAVKIADGTVICGPRHWDNTMRAQAKALGVKPGKGEEQGFVDQFGNFLSRKEAYKVAKDNDQICRNISGDDETLYSEHLY